METMSHFRWEVALGVGVWIADSSPSPSSPSRDSGEYRGSFCSIDSKDITDATQRGGGGSVGQSRLQVPKATSFNRPASLLTQIHVGKTWSTKIAKEACKLVHNATGVKIEGALSVSLLGLRRLSTGTIQLDSNISFDSAAACKQASSYLSHSEHLSRFRGLASAFGS